jgi:O-acetyl-ADP-ribose deacetylase (regulator of RNase III)
MLKVLTGNLFESKAGSLVNTVNCIGIMGKGVALEFKKRYPAMFEDYARRCGLGQVRLGEPYPYRDASGILIVNFPTKDHWRSPSRLADIEHGLDYFVQHHAEWDIRSVAFPALGCGNGGLDWQRVRPLMVAKLGRLKVDIEIYAPTDAGNAPPKLSDTLPSTP